MSGKLNRVEGIAAVIRSNDLLLQEFKYVYLFGSILRNGYLAHDLDILLIYDGQKDLRKGTIHEIKSQFERDIGLPIDLTILNEEEEQQVRFLERIDGQYLRII